MANKGFYQISRKNFVHTSLPFLCPPISQFFLFIFFCLFVVCLIFICQLHRSQWKVDCIRMQYLHEEFVFVQNILIHYEIEFTVCILAHPQKRSDVEHIKGMRATRAVQIPEP